MKNYLKNMNQSKMKKKQIMISIKKIQKKQKNQKNQKKK